MTFDERLIAIRDRLAESGFEVLIGVHDGAHFIEKPNPVMVLTGFRALGPAAVLLDGDGAVTLVVTPEWDAERASALGRSMRIVPAADVVEGVAVALGARAATIAAGVAGLSAFPHRLARRLRDALPKLREADALVFAATLRKTDEEIAHARAATRIAEAGFQRLLAIARPGMSEDELAAELRWHSRSLGADDNFALMCAGPHNRAVAPSNGRRMQPGDIIVCELTPSYRGQLAQICRTIVLGEASPMLREAYGLVLRAMDAGFAAARPGVAMADVCRAINAVLEAKGYGEYCHPPHIRRRGHGLGFASIEPGDVALDNETVLAPDMLFMIHPNQYLPETGYLLCGEPALLTPNGARALTVKQAALAEIAV